MKLPPAVTVTPAAAQAIGSRHGIPVDHLEELPSRGIINTVFALSDHHVLRVPRDHPAHIAQAAREAEVIPLAVAAGVRTADLVAYDDSREVLGVPYLVVQRIRGTDVESTVDDPRELHDVWREVGRDLGRLHIGVAADPGQDRTTSPNLVEEGPTDPDVLVEDRVRDGWFTAIEAAWLHRWLDRLRAAAGSEAVPKRLVHGDVQMSNVLIDRDHRYAGLIDWGCAAWRDCVADFMPTPMFLAPLLLAGHRDIGPLDGDEGAEARILLGEIHALLAVLPRGAAPGHTWGETPVAWLMDLLRFFQDPPDELWAALAPGA